MPFRRVRLAAVLWPLLLARREHAAAADVEAVMSTPKCAVLDPRESSAWKDYGTDGKDRWQFSYNIRVPQW